MWGIRYLKRRGTAALLREQIDRLQTLLKPGGVAPLRWHNPTPPRRRTEADVTYVTRATIAAQQALAREDARLARWRDGPSTARSPTAPARNSPSSPDAAA